MNQVTDYAVNMRLITMKTLCNKGWVKTSVYQWAETGITQGCTDPLQTASSPGGAPVLESPGHIQTVGRGQICYFSQWLMLWWVKIQRGRRLCIYTDCQAECVLLADSVALFVNLSCFIPMAWCHHCDLVVNGATSHVVCAAAAARAPFISALYQL